MDTRDDVDSGPITTKDYWEASWSLDDVPGPVDPTDVIPENRLQIALHERFRRALADAPGAGARLIEIGCGGSRWLPYFHKVFGYDVSGIDYSPKGVLLAQAILDRAGVTADLAQGDLFDPPARMIEQFDVVASFGVVEHFDRTALAVAACARYLRPGGLLITTVPTMRGPYGLVYRWLQPSVYRVHVPQSLDGLAQAHRDAGLQITDCSYVLGMPTVLTRPAVAAPWWRRLAFAASGLYFALERRGLGIPPNRLTSPYAVCIATKPHS
jgi:2-polyprenyl-3-methyl-5-hydroxy-6-metoxy-1,4-benzoquinol methylase